MSASVTGQKTKESMHPYGSSNVQKFISESNPFREELQVRQFTKLDITFFVALIYSIIFVCFMGYWLIKKFRNRKRESPEVRALKKRRRAFKPARIEGDPGDFPIIPLKGLDRNKEAFRDELSDRDTNVTFKGALDRDSDDPRAANDGGESDPLVSDEITRVNTLKNGNRDQANDKCSDDPEPDPDKYDPRRYKP